MRVSDVSSRRAVSAVVLATAGLLASVSVAHASTAGTSGGVLDFSASPGEQNDAAIVLEGAQYRVSDAGVAQVMAGDGCAATPDPRTVVCSAEGVTSISAGLEDGDDRLVVDAPVRTLVLGGAGVDTLVGGESRDELLGGAGGDTLRGRGGNDRILELDEERNILDGGAGQDFLQGGAGPDDVLGGAGNDEFLLGGEGDDLIDGGDGDDVLDGGDGPTIFQRDTDRLVGGAGVDQASYERRVLPLTVSMGDGPGDGDPGEGDDVTADIEQLAGGQGNDTLLGGPGADTIDGRGRSDVIEGGAGADRLDGGASDAASDTIRGGEGEDLLEGRGGTDQLEGGDDADRLAGEAGGDRLLGGAGADTLDGGAEDDELDGGIGADTMTGGDGTDTVRYGLRAAPVQVTIDGIDNDGEIAPTRGGRTRLEEGAESRERDNVDDTNERVTASQQDDTVAGDGAPNALEGSTGEDYLDGAGGADTLSGGGRGDAILSRDRAKDRVSCGAGYDYVVADRRDLVPRRASKCEYVDDGSRTVPQTRRDVAVDPRCASRTDAEISPPGTERGMPVDRRVLVPVRSRVDAFDCAVKLTVAVGRGRVRSGTLGRRTGALEVRQRRSKGGRVITRLEATDCKAVAAAAGPRARAARVPKPKYQRKYGKIAFPVEVKVGAALVSKRRGIATWTVTDRCNRSATIEVTSGRLTVLDLGTDRRVVLGPGEKHTARVPE